MPTANKVLMYRWFEEVWNKKRREVIFELLHPEALIYGFGDNPVVGIKGPEGFVPFWEKFTQAFPDLNLAVESTMAEADKVMARCSARGRHSGPGLGIPPTGNAISVTGLCLVQMKDGQFHECWNSFDFLTMYQQLGLLPKLGG